MGGRHMPSIHELIREVRLLLKEEGAVFASPEDAAYFRKKISPPVQLPRQKEVIPLPPPPQPLRVEPPPPLKQEKVELPPTITPTKPKPSSFIRTLLAQIAPQLQIIDEIPSDLNARQIATRWKTKNKSAPISILSSSELPEHKAFLNELAIALDVYFGPAKIIEAESIEQEKQWEPFLHAEGLKLIVMCDSSLWQLQELRKFYRETPAAATRTLGKIPLFLLPDLSLYLKDPLLKRSLWNALVQKCS